MSQNVLGARIQGERPERKVRRDKFHRVSDDTDYGRASTKSQHKRWCWVRRTAAKLRSSAREVHAFTQMASQVVKRRAMDALSVASRVWRMCREERYRRHLVGMFGRELDFVSSDEGPDEFSTAGLSVWVSFPGGRSLVPASEFFAEYTIPVVPAERFVRPVSGRHSDFCEMSYLGTGGFFTPFVPDPRATCNPRCRLYVRPAVGVAPRNPDPPVDLVGTPVGKRCLSCGRLNPYAYAAVYWGEKDTPYGRKRVRMFKEKLPEVPHGVVHTRAWSWCPVTKPSGYHFDNID